MQEGDVACPGAPYDTKTVVYGGMDDTRGCEDCSCGAPTGISCEGDVELFTGVACTGSSLGSTPVPGCFDWPMRSGTFYFRADFAPTGGSCASSGGAPTGDVTPAEPTTLCCTGAIGG